MRRNARKLEEVSVSHAKKFIVDRFDNIKSVRRHALGWLVVVGLLIAVSALQLMGYQKSYSFEAPVAGGVYAEGVVGPLETINPILARSQAELSASRLVFRVFSTTTQQVISGVSLPRRGELKTVANGI